MIAGTIHVSIEKRHLIGEIRRLGLRAVLTVPNGTTEDEMIARIERDPRAYFVMSSECDRTTPEGQCAGHPPVEPRFAEVRARRHQPYKREIFASRLALEPVVSVRIEDGGHAWAASAATLREALEELARGRLATVRPPWVRDGHFVEVVVTGEGCLATGQGETLGAAVGDALGRLTCAGGAL